MTVVAYETFRQELYVEHLEEASFLYETRLSWLEDEEVGWQDLADIDSRLEAHIDALIVGGKLALKLCMGNLEEADFSTLHIIVRLLCRYQSIDVLAKLWDSLDYDDAEKTQAVADALRWDCPLAWLPHLVKVFETDKAEMFPILVPSVIAGARSAGKQLLAALTRTNEDDLIAMLYALSHCERGIKNEATQAIAPYVNSANIDVARQATSALLMMGEHRVLAQCAGRIEKLPGLFAIGGGVADSRKLIAFAAKGIADGQCLIAIGLTGNLESVPSLLGYLKHPDYAPQAARALHLITGAPLFEDVHVADDVEEDELFEHELAAFKKGELPKNIDGDPFGAEVKQLTIEVDSWRKWLEVHRSQFTQGLRYRNGQPFSPIELIKNLIDNQTPHNIRQLAYEELVIRYSLPLPFIADDLVSKQQSQLNEIYRWGQQSLNTWQAGRWYFDSRPLSV